MFYWDKVQKVGKDLAQSVKSFLPVILPGSLIVRSCARGLQTFTVQMEMKRKLGFSRCRGLGGNEINRASKNVGSTMRLWLHIMQASVISNNGALFNEINAKGVQSDKVQQTASQNQNATRLKVKRLYVNMT